MTRVTINLGAFLFVVWSCCSAFGQTFARSPAASEEATQLQALSKKIDEQNAKIDTLSQQILKLEQQISSLRPGVMVGEATPAAAPRAGRYWARGLHRARTDRGPADRQPGRRLLVGLRPVRVLGRCSAVRA